jgi:hypothetical protein
LISIIRIIKARKMIWSGNVARMEGRGQEKRNAYMLLVENPEERDLWDD